MKKNRNRPQLTLTPETVRTLADAALTAIGGGLVPADTCKATMCASCDYTSAARKCY